MAEAHRSEGTRRAAQEEVAHASLLSAAIIENRKDMMRARRALAARGKAVSVAELQHFFYGQFRHTIEYRLLKLAMRVEEDLGEDDGLDASAPPASSAASSSAAMAARTSTTSTASASPPCPRASSGRAQSARPAAAAAARGGGGRRAHRPPPPPPSSASARRRSRTETCRYRELKAEVRRRGPTRPGASRSSDASLELLGGAGGAARRAAAAPAAAPPPRRVRAVEPPRRRVHHADERHRLGTCHASRRVRRPTNSYAPRARRKAAQSIACWRQFDGGGESTADRARAAAAAAARIRRSRRPIAADLDQLAELRAARRDVGAG